MSKGHFVFEIGFFKAISLFITLLAIGFVGGAVFASVKGNSLRPARYGN